MPVCALPGRISTIALQKSRAMGETSHARAGFEPGGHARGPALPGRLSRTCRAGATGGAPGAEPNRPPGPEAVGHAPAGDAGRGPGPRPRAQPLDRADGRPVGTFSSPPDATGTYRIASRSTAARRVAPGPPRRSGRRACARSPPRPQPPGRTRVIDGRGRDGRTSRHRQRLLE